MLQCNIVHCTRKLFTSEWRTIMNTAIYENMNKFGKSSFDAMKEFYAVNTNIVEQLFEQQLALTSLGVEYFTRQLQLASSAKGYKEVINGQTDILTDASGKMQGIARNTLDIFNESRDEINSWFEKNVKEAEKGIKEVAKVIPVPAKAA
jgi:phasin family protein